MHQLYCLLCDGWVQAERIFDASGNAYWVCLRCDKAAGLREAPPSAPYALPVQTSAGIVWKDVSPKVRKK